MSLKLQNQKPLVVLAILGLGLCGTSLVAQEKPAKPVLGKTAAAPTEQTAHDAADRLAQNLHKQLDVLEDQREGLRRQRQEISDRIVAICGLSPENVKPVMLDLERELFMLTLGAETKRVRIKLLEKRVAEVTARTQEVAVHDSVAAELEKIVAARQAELKILQTHFNTGQVTASEVSKAEAELAEAEVRLAMRKQETAKPGGDDEREKLSGEVRELSMETTLEEVRGKELDSRLAKLREARGLVDRFGDESNRIAALDREIDRGRALLLQIELGVPGVQSY
jgi:hypothetical protein